MKKENVRKRRRVVNPILICRTTDLETTLEYTTPNRERNKHYSKCRTNVKINNRGSKLKAMLYLFDKNV